VQVDCGGLLEADVHVFLYELYNNELCDERLQLLTD
jgi:hypothetical protein